MLLTDSAVGLPADAVFAECLIGVVTRVEELADVAAFIVRDLA